ncbi:MAG: UMP kinase [Gemmatimonadota bacterium]
MAETRGDETAPAVKYRRVLLKLSGEVLAGQQGFGISMEAVDRLAAQVTKVHELGVALGLVIGGGNIMRGTRASQEGLDRVNADYMGMLATVINALAAIRMEQLAEPYIRRRALRHLEKGRVVIFAGGTGNPYFSTDTAAVLRAIEMEADVLIKATKVEGVFSADPVKNPDAEFLPHLTFMDVMTRELRVMDAAAVSLCKDNDVPIVVLNIQDRDSVVRAIRGERVGTLVS